GIFNSQNAVRNLSETNEQSQRTFYEPPRSVRREVETSGNNGRIDAVEILSQGDQREQSETRFPRPGSKEHLEGGGPYEKANRDHRREAPAGCAESAKSFDRRLVRNLCCASTDGHA